jgi:hypothetical protein
MVLVFRVQGSGFRGQGLGFRVQGLGFRVYSWRRAPMNESRVVSLFSSVVLNLTTSCSV